MFSLRSGAFTPAMQVAISYHKCDGVTTLPDPPIPPSRPIPLSWRGVNKELHHSVVEVESWILISFGNLKLWGRALGTHRSSALTESAAGSILPPSAPPSYSPWGARGGQEGHGVSMGTYRAVIFDMFDTLVNFRNVHLPLIRVNGREVRSTSPFVYEALKPLCAHVPFEEFFQAFVGAYRAAEEIRNREQREVTAHERFRMVFAQLQIPDGPGVSGFMEAGIAEHMRQLARAMEFPESHRTILDRLQPQYRLAIISNFDHGPTVEMALKTHGIRDRFEAVVVSADTGWRKPRPEIFEAAFRQMGIGPADGIFVGDTPEVDVLGAQAVGMDVIWIDNGTKALPPGTPPPTHTVRSFVEVGDLL